MESRKIMAVLAGVIFCASLVACGGQPAASVNEQPEESSSVPPPRESTAAEPEEASTGRFDALLESLRAPAGSGDYEAVYTLCMENPDFAALAKEAPIEEAYYLGDVDDGGGPNGRGIGIFTHAPQYPARVEDPDAGRPCVYYGDWVNGLPDGEGTVLIPYSDFMMNGERGLHATVSIYEGEWAGGQPEGAGVCGSFIITDASASEAPPPRKVVMMEWYDGAFSAGVAEGSFTYAKIAETYDHYHLQKEEDELARDSYEYAYIGTELGFTQGRPEESALAVQLLPSEDMSAEAIDLRQFLGTDRWAWEAGDNILTAYGIKKLTA